MRDEPLSLPVLSYLVPPADGFWRWEYGGGVISWHSGETICFASELHAMLSAFSGRPLPPLDMLLLVAAATRDNWMAASRASLSVDSWSVDGHCPDQTQTAVLLAALDRVSQWNGDVRASLPAKRAIAESVFQRLAGPADSYQPELLAAVADGVPEAVWAVDRSGRPLAPANSGRYAWWQFLAGLAELDPAAVRERMATGLDAAPKAAPEELAAEIVERVRSLIGGSFDDELLQGIAGLARQLMGVVSLPQPLALRETRLDGGFADISNRGTPDRLLQSELAHDDLVFATRLALGESLYLRRESPPAALARDRSVLVDTGIRLWGVSRVFAAAVTLAMAATTDRRGRLRIARAADSAVAPVTVDSREGLNALLSALSPQPHPGAALAAWSSDSRLGEEQSEAILVTAREVWDDREFRAALRANGPARLFAALVDREGRFELVRRTESGEQSLRKATLDLSKLLDRRTRHSVLAHDASGEMSGLDELPAIFRVSPFPLRLWAKQQDDIYGAATLFPQKGGVYVSVDRRMMFGVHPRNPSVQLCEQVPKGRFIWHEFSACGRHLRAVFGNIGAPKLYAVDADLSAGTAALRGFSPSMHQPIGFELQGELLWIMGGPICVGEDLQRKRLWGVPRNDYYGAGYRTGLDVAALDWESLRQIDYQRSSLHNLLRSPGVPGLIGCRLKSDKQFFCLALNGGKITETPIDLDWLGDERIISLFRRPGVDGFCGFTNQGHFVDTVHRRLTRLVPGPIVSVTVARDGRAARCSLSDNSSIVVDLSNPETVSVCERGHLAWTEFSTNRPFFFSQTYLGRRRRKLSRVAVGRDRIALQAKERNGESFCMELVRDAAQPSESRWRWIERRLTSAEAQLQQYDLRELSPLMDIHYKAYGLRRALVGSLVVVIDDRGLLHLKSRSGKHPELTLTLAKHGSPAAWRSDGRRFGDPGSHFPSAEPAGSLEELDETLRRLLESAHV